ncbi:PAS domain S-box protein [bacterium]|nr:PAS domain S-box protein [bacterium]
MITEYAHKSVNQIYVTREGAIWLGSNHGVFIFQQHDFDRVEEPFPFTYITAMAKGEENALYVSGGEQVYRLDVNSKPKVVKKIYKKEASFITALAWDRGTLYIGYRDGFVDVFEEDKTRKIPIPEQANRVIFNLYADRNHCLWICQDGLKGVYCLKPSGQVTHFGEKSGLVSHINTIMEDRNGNLWLGGNGQSTYLYRFNREKNSFQNVSAPLPFIPHFELAVVGLASNPEGGFWLATTSGLLQWSDSVVKRMNMNLETGLGRLTSMVSDGEQLWLGGSRGLVRYTRNQFVPCSLAEGLPSLTINDRGLLLDANGLLWVATANGLVCGEKGLFRKTKTYPPQIYELIMNETVVSIDEMSSSKMLFPYKSYLKAEFGSLMFPADNLVYQTRIPALHPYWSRPSRDNHAVFPHLPPGNHLVQIRAQKPGYLWSEPAIISFSIRHPFYWSYGAFLVYLAVFIVLAAIVWILVKGARERKLARQKLIQSEKRFRDLVESAGSAILCIDEDHTVFELNQEALRLFQVNKTDAIGKHCLELFSRQKNGEAFERHIETVIEGNNVRDYVTSIQISDSDASELLWNLTPMRDAHNHFRGLIAIGQDITERRKMEDELKQAKQAAEEASQAKNEFMAKMSHELRTPLNSVIGFAQVLMKKGKERFGENEIQFLSRINQNGKHLLDLINDILDITKLEAGKITLQKKTRTYQK